MTDEGSGEETQSARLFEAMSAIAVRMARAPTAHHRATTWRAKNAFLSNMVGKETRKSMSNTDLRLLFQAEADYPLQLSV